jgi:transposase-like protein
MPQERLLLNIPESCPSCDASRTVKLEHTLNGAKIALKWCCSSCLHEWPVALSDERATHDRRTSTSDRRQRPRSDRRRP